MPSREPTYAAYALGPEPAPAAPVLPLECTDTDVGPAMRASSWGDVGEYGRLLRAHEVASLHSGAGEHDEPLDPDVVVVGAGGVALAPLPPTPSGSAGVLAALAGIVPPYGAMCNAQPHISAYSSEGDADASDGDSDSFFARNSEEAARGAFSRAHLHPHAHPHAHTHIPMLDVELAMMSTMTTMPVDGASVVLACAAWDERRTVCPERRCGRRGGMRL
ncbi:hypothetical protein EI94DRAFT_1150139 [Lactarius quietus]|nr:hypothetical protein EI94DRAFT_1150139 [Lactarius quietus]